MKTLAFLSLDFFNSLFCNLVLLLFAELSMEGEKETAEEEEEEENQLHPHVAVASPVDYQDRAHHPLGGPEPADRWAGETGAGEEGEVKGQLWTRVVELTRWCFFSVESESSSLTDYVSHEHLCCTSFLQSVNMELGQRQRTQKIFSDMNFPVVSVCVAAAGCRLVHNKQEHPVGACRASGAEPVEQQGRSL